MVMSAPRAASGEPRVAALIAGPGSGIRLRVIFPRLGVAADIAPGSPRRRRRRGRAQAENRSSPKCGEAIRSILSSSRPIFFKAFSVLPINIIPQTENPTAALSEGALWASLATRKFQLWHQGGAWDWDAPGQRQPKGCEIVASLQHAREIVAPGGDWKVLYKAWEG
jgi:hypothetical protein